MNDAFAMSLSACFERIHCKIVKVQTPKYYSKEMGCKSMQWLISLLNRNVLKNWRQPVKKLIGRRGTAMSLLALFVGGAAYGLTRRRNRGNMLQQILQPIRSLIMR
jgi:hypothetical protein